MDDHWLFSDSPNSAVFTIQQIVKQGQPILRVSHDEDGSWQFLSWGIPAETDAMIVSLAYIVSIDPAVKQLADIPLGWRAWRLRAEDEWICGPLQLP